VVSVVVVVVVVIVTPTVIVPAASVVIIVVAVAPAIAVAVPPARGDRVGAPEERRCDEHRHEDCGRPEYRASEPHDGSSLA
jgi:hypothetical protein